VISRLGTGKSLNFFTVYKRFWNDLTPRSFHLQLAGQVGLHRRFELMSSLSGVRHSNQRASLLVASLSRCNVSPSPADVSPTENSWMLHPLDRLSLGYFAPDRTVPSLNSDLIERSDTQLPNVGRISAAKQWSSMCGPSVHPTEGRQSNKPGQGRRQSRPDAPLIH
jgi:hypothetical protein